MLDRQFCQSFYPNLKRKPLNYNMTAKTRTRVDRADKRTTMKKRPVCEASGCTNKAMFMYRYDDDTYLWRTRFGKFICSTHQRHTWHPYLQHRKDHCENKDGRLGFQCTTTIFWPGMLDVDHKNGNPSDNRPKNLQTLCKCCHSYKTHKYGDAQTPGRGSMKRK
jgi:hypothetical protein